LAAEAVNEPATLEEPDDPGHGGPTPPPTHLLARSAVAVAAAVLPMVAAVLALRHRLPSELLELVVRYFDWLFGLTG
jgi:hypothetical protein